MKATRWCLLVTFMVAASTIGLLNIILLHSTGTEMTGPSHRLDRSKQPCPRQSLSDAVKRASQAELPELVAAIKLAATRMADSNELFWPHPPRMNLDQTAPVASNDVTLLRPSPQPTAAIVSRQSDAPTPGPTKGLAAASVPGNCPLVCQDCSAGGATDGGVELVGGVCTHWCSRGKHCGNEGLYTRGTNCGVCDAASGKGSIPSKAKAAKNSTAEQQRIRAMVEKVVSTASSSSGQCVIPSLDPWDPTIANIIKSEIALTEKNIVQDCSSVTAFGSKSSIACAVDAHHREACTTWH